MDNSKKSEFVSRMEAIANENRPEIKNTQGEKGLIVIATEKVDSCHNHTSISTIGNRQSIVASFAEFLKIPNYQSIIRDAMALVENNPGLHLN